MKLHEEIKKTCKLTKRLTRILKENKNYKFTSQSKFITPLSINNHVHYGDEAHSFKDKSISPKVEWPKTATFL